MAKFDPIKSLEDAGMLSPLPPGHEVEGHGATAAHRVLGTLTEEEVDVLKSIRERMAAESAQDVEAHIEKDGTVCW